MQLVAAQAFGILAVQPKPLDDKKEEEEVSDSTEPA
jgi:hypothetical protein